MEIPFRPSIISTVVCMLFLMFTSVVHAGVETGSFERGKALHNEDCLTCHTPEKYYLRKNRIVNSFPRLIIQVRKCQLDVGAEWDADQFNDVLLYVNRTYYKFDPVADTGNKKQD